MVALQERQEAQTSDGELPELPSAQVTATATQAALALGPRLIQSCTCTGSRSSSTRVRRGEPRCQKAPPRRTKPPGDKAASEEEGAGAGQLGLHKLAVTAGDVWVREEKEEQTGSLFAANALGELIKETRRKLQSVENEAADVWKRKKHPADRDKPCQAPLCGRRHAPHGDRTGPKGRNWCLGGGKHSKAKTEKAEEH